MLKQTSLKVFLILAVFGAVAVAIASVYAWQRARLDSASQIIALEQALNGLIRSSLHEQLKMPAEARNCLREYGFPQLNAAQLASLEKAEIEHNPAPELKVFWDNSGRREWFAVILMRAVERLHYERMLPVFAAKMIVNGKTGRPLFAADALDRFRQLPAVNLKILSVLRQREAHNIYGRRDEDTLKRLCEWTARVLPLAEVCRSEDFIILPQDLLLPLTGFTQQFGSRKALIIGPAPTLAERDLLIVHEALHTPVASLFRLDDTFRAAVRSSSHLMSTCLAQEKSLAGYDDWDSLLSESLVRSLSRRFTRSEIGPTWALEERLDRIVANQLSSDKYLNFTTMIRALEDLSVNFREGTEHVRSIRH